MASFSDYIADGVSAMNTARDGFTGSTASEWKEGAVNYALAEQANANEVAMWQMQQEYNTPAAQMQRLKDAGLNPNLAYQMANTGTASSAPSVHQAAAPNFAAHKQAQIAQSQAIINSVLGLASTLQDLTGKSYSLQAQQMQNEESLMRLNLLRKLSSNMEGKLPQDSTYFAELLSKGYNNAWRANLQSQLLPFQKDWYELRNISQGFINEKMLPLQKDLLSGKITDLNFSNQLKEYNNELMRSMSPEVRMLWSVLTQGLSVLAKYKYW